MTLYLEIKSSQSTQSICVQAEQLVGASQIPLCKPLHILIKNEVRLVRIIIQVNMHRLGKLDPCIKEKVILGSL